MNRNINIPWPDWKVVQVLGHGGYGAVYEIERDAFGEKEKTALKVMSIPKEEWEIDEDYRNGFTEQEITSKYRELLEQYKNEYLFMMKMKGQSNIVSCEDIYVEKQKNGYGYNIYIRMELLKPLNQYLQTQILSEPEVVRIGKDICQALILCHSQNIIHRDIKPSNIFRSSYGNYKLGDFGISKVMEQTTTATGIGTKGYAAPEVFLMTRYGKTADIYSLGVVLYELLNERRMPFMEENKTPSQAGLQKAILKRYSGEVFDPPKNGSEQLKRIVMKACMYEAGERYQSAEEMLEDLENLKSGSARGDQIESKKKNDPLQEENVRTELVRESIKKEEKYKTALIKSDEKEEEFETAPKGSEKKEEAFSEELLQSKVEEIAQDSIHSAEEKDIPKKKKLKVSFLIGSIGAVAVLGGVLYFVVSGGINKKKDATSMRTPVILDEISKGAVIRFGRYEQDNDLTNGAEPIEWNVLDVQDGGALLISKYGLDSMIYHDEWAAVTWETCTLRQWLNHDFMEKAFSSEEAGIIQTTSVTADTNPDYKIDPGNTTKDQIFLLSINEALQYFESAEARECVPTQYAIAQGAYTSDTYTSDGEATSWWWLRSPGSADNMAAMIYGSGSVDFGGDYVNYDNCVRPALWINLES